MSALGQKRTRAEVATKHSADAYTAQLSQNNHLANPTATNIPIICATMNAATPPGAMPAKVCAMTGRRRNSV